MASKPPFPPKPGFPGAAQPMGRSPFPAGISMPRNGPQMSAGPARKYQPDIERAARQSGAPPVQINEFLNFWEQSQFPVIKNFLAALGTGEEVYKAASFFFLFRKLGVAVNDIARVFVVVVGLRSARALGFMEYVIANSANISRALKGVGNVAKGITIFVAAIEAYNLIAKGEWSQATASIYKSAMGLAVPWTAVIELVQTVLPEQTPKSAAWFKVLKACDPVGLGGTAIDTLAFFAWSLVDKWHGRPFNEQRLGQLVARMKTGPTAMFAQLGEESGDALYDILQMDAADWKLVGRYTVDQFTDWVRNIGN
jgi:hypothetical protein